MFPKFRAWDKKKKKFIRLSALHIEESGENVGLVYDMSEHYISTAFSVGGGRSLNLIDGVLMQSTGLKDKNDVEIFEGDVLYYIPFESHINDSIIVFEKGSFCKKMLRNGKLTSVKFIDSEEYEVIGNVYENPELLEVAE